MGRNPATGDGLVLDARRVVAFKCSKTLRQSINGNEKSGDRLCGTKTNHGPN
jgi:hypothetical protein